MGFFSKQSDASVSPSDSSRNEAPAPRKAAVWNHQPIAGVKRIIAIGSGKGGVGKSTSTVLLAHSLAAQGLQVGILDADIYGPSMPQMLGLAAQGKPDLTVDRQMIPPRNYGIRCHSMGFLLGAQEAAIWRGPMVTKALNQLARGTQWAAEGEMLDILLIDLPPGTGDVHLSMVQQIPLDGAIVVTTPQEVALADARKCANMFEKVKTPICGVIENMSYFVDDQGAKHVLFGEGGGQMLADELAVPLLAQLPMYPALASAMDQGEQPDATYCEPLNAAIKAIL